MAKSKGGAREQGAVRLFYSRSGALESGLLRLLYPRIAPAIARGLPLLACHWQASLTCRLQWREARLWSLDCFATARKDGKQGFGVWIASLPLAKTRSKALGSGLLRYRSQRREARLWSLDCFTAVCKDGIASLIISSHCSCNCLWAWYWINYSFWDCLWR